MRPVQPIICLNGSVMRTIENKLEFIIKLYFIIFCLNNNDYLCSIKSILQALPFRS